MRKLVAVASVALLTLVPVSAASAKSKPKSKSDAFAAKHHFKGGWKSKDADKDGLKNVKEFKLGTNPRKADTDKDKLRDGDELASGNDPRKADTDGDGVKDGAEHAGVVTAFDGETITIREFATRKTVTATLDTDCSPASWDEDEDPTADDSSFDDGTFVDVTEEEGGEFFQDDSDEEAVEADTASSCEDDELDKGVVLQSAVFQDGALVDYVLA